MSGPADLPTELRTDPPTDLPKDPPTDLLQGPLAIVDVETTGGNPLQDRVIEIAVIELDNGEETGRWSSLVNPGISVPPVIEGLTGIGNRMLIRAPRFPEIAASLAQRLSGRLFIAHNVRFDFGFVTSEFARAGLEYCAPTLCTVRLSRRLYPHHRYHNLDALIERHGLACGDRHRAMGDAQALVQFLRTAREECGEAAITDALRRIFGKPALRRIFGKPALRHIAGKAVPPQRETPNSPVDT